MTTTANLTDQSTFTVSEEIYVRASLEQTFESLLAQLGPLNETPDGRALTMVLEARPGGRWYRDLGGDNGHLWGFVQSIKRPSLLEVWGPLMMSTGATSNMIYRLSEKDGGTLRSFKHTLVGPVSDEAREKMPPGWAAMNANVKKNAERSAERKPS